MASEAASPTGARRRRGLALAEGLTAVSAVAGALGLVTGSIDLGETINRRLPFESPVFGGAALTVVVGLPMAAGAVSSWHGGRRTDVMAVSAGGALMGWIVVELAVIRSLSWLQPTLFLVGAAIAWAGFRGEDSLRLHRPPTPPPTDRADAGVPLAGATGPGDPARRHR